MDIDFLEKVIDNVEYFTGKSGEDLVDNAEMDFNMVLSNIFEQLIDDFKQQIIDYIESSTDKDTEDIEEWVEDEISENYYTNYCDSNVEEEFINNIITADSNEEIDQFFREAQNYYMDKISKQNS